MLATHAHRRRKAGQGVRPSPRTNSRVGQDRFHHRAGRADLALTIALDLVITRDRGLNLTSVGSLIQHPLGGLIALSEAGIRKLSDCLKVVEAHGEDVGPL